MTASLGTEVSFGSAWGTIPLDLPIRPTSHGHPCLFSHCACVRVRRGHACEHLSGFPPRLLRDYTIRPLSLWHALLLLDILCLSSALVVVLGMVCLGSIAHTIALLSCCDVVHCDQAKEDDEDE